MLAGMEALVKPSELMGTLGPVPPKNKAALSKGEEDCKAQIRVCRQRVLDKVGRG